MRDVFFLLDADTRLLFSLDLLLCTVFQLNAAVLVDLALYLAVGGLCLGLVELSCSLSLSCFQHVWPRFFGCLSLEPFHVLFLLLKLAGSRSTSLHLAIALLSTRGRASACSGPCCESLSGSSALSVHFDHLLKTFWHHIDRKFPGCPHSTLRRLAGRSRCACPHSIWDISLVEFERQVLSHCNHTFLIQLGVPVSGYRAETRSSLSLVQIHSFTILLFSLVVLLRDVSPASSETSKSYTSMNF